MKNTFFPDRVHLVQWPFKYFTYYIDKPYIYISISLTLILILITINTFISSHNVSKIW